MTAPQPEPTPEELARIFVDEIRSILFPDDAASDSPALILLGGQPGAGKSRATHSLLREYDFEPVPLSGDDLRAFHPRYRELITRDPIHAPDAFAPVTAAWVRAAIDHARNTQRSLLLEGTFHTPELTLATARAFSDAGFQVHVVATGASRADSLLSATSRYFRSRRENLPARFTSRTAHDRGYDGTTALVAQLETSPHIDRVTILDRDGKAGFDVRRATPHLPDGEFTTATAALERARTRRVGTRTAVAWLSELRRMTQYAEATRQVTTQTAELLIPLHEIAVRDIVPTIPLPAGSEPGRKLETRVAQDLAALRRAVVALDPDAAAPHRTPAPGTPSPDLAR
ncbi:zeta toxin family protein [Microbacterium immunditiarum]|uniref:UDP-N-acetylglucosamine kinase n=1 Tax=Microbacterium immunditiarum TaxID=337480 RepID=A0A7Y9GKC7_9MICO|nr:hypothetical protein [Microbacterium immunditiarum]